MKVGPSLRSSCYAGKIPSIELACKAREFGLVHVLGKNLVVEALLMLNYEPLAVGEP